MVQPPSGCGANRSNLGRFVVKHKKYGGSVTSAKGCVERGIVG
jgi:hypothetical protein